jgi:photosystem II stability/assembly factor-like uncharacterized protein
MKNKITKLGLLLLLTVAMVACVSATSITKIAGDSWKEEIELHDGSTMIIKRTQHYKGRHEIGQAVPVGEHTVSFTLPQTGKSYTWTSEYGEELGRTNFNLLAVHVLDNTPYIVVTPNGCFSYNKWGRPNPPYVIFKHDGSTWQRIPLSELPPMFTTINVLVSITDKDTRGISSMRTISAATIKARNSELSQPEYKTLLREPVKKGGGLASCPDYNSEQYRSFKAPTSNSTTDK